MSSAGRLRKYLDALEGRGGGRRATTGRPSCPLLKNLDRRDVEKSSRLEVLIGAKRSVLVLNELCATIVRQVPLQKRVHRAAAVLRAIQRPARRRHVPNLAGPVATKADVQDELLRAKHVRRVRAARRPCKWIVGDEPLIPGVRLRVIVQQVFGHPVIWDLEDLHEGLGPLDHESHRMHVPLGRALQGQAVRSTTELLRIVRGAVVVHVVEIGEVLAPWPVELRAVDLALVISAGVQRGLRDDVVDVLQNVQLSAFWPPFAVGVGPKSRPQATTPRHMSEAHCSQEVLPMLHRPDLG
mmetsp:Transcript_34429/g.87633  ORF Transcript_34429/g.87633 Transcript_34429/m.87633 type:complete len:297 (-) Transcript_34429:913-1803(-)